jgi:hypothetical protein
MEEWSGTNPEVVSLDYVDGVYTMPLGPLTSGAWDENAAHLPEIPLATETDRLADEARAAEDVKAHEAARIESAKKGFGKAGVSSNRGAAPKTNSANAIRKGPDDRVAKKTVDYRLFRFADYGVEPNKRYRYRVQLVMVNPNYDLPDKLLKNIDSKLSEKRTTPWSEPSPMVEMPRGEGLLVGGPKPPARGQINPEPSATILVYTVEPETGLEAAAERQVSRGSVLNFKSMVSLHNPTTKKTEERAVAFDTGALILDIQGGREMRSSGREKLLEPSEVLLLDGNSRLVAHSEMDDLDLYAQHSPNASEEAAAAPTRPGRDEPAASPGKKKSGGGGGNILDEKVNTGKKK